MNNGNNGNNSSIDYIVIKDNPTNIKDLDEYYYNIMKKYRPSIKPPLKSRRLIIKNKSITKKIDKEITKITHKLSNTHISSPSQSPSQSPSPLKIINKDIPLSLMDNLSTKYYGLIPIYANYSRKRTHDDIHKIAIQYTASLHPLHHKLSGGGSPKQCLLYKGDHSTDIISLFEATFGYVDSDIIAIYSTTLSTNITIHMALLNESGYLKEIEGYHWINTCNLYDITHKTVDHSDIYKRIIETSRLRFNEWKFNNSENDIPIKITYKTIDAIYEFKPTDLIMFNVLDKHMMEN